MFDFDQETIDAILLAAERPTGRAKQRGCTPADRALILALFSHPATTESLAESGVKLTQTNKSFTLKFEKGSIGWEQFLEAGAAVIKKMATKKQISMLRKYLK
jgi:hypothetical protein